MFVFTPQGGTSELQMEFPISSLHPKSSLTPQLTAPSACELLIDDVGFEFLRHSLGANWVIIYKHHLIIMPIH